MKEFGVLRGWGVAGKGFSRLIDIRHLKRLIGVNADGIFAYWQADCD
ncbi:hypothetical protein [Burkholderia sp. F1]